MASTTYYSSSDWELSEEYLAPRQQGQTLAENFIISDEANEGGMGRVFFCQDKRDKKFYALKTFRENNPAYEHILREEALFSLSLDPHPHIVYTRTVAQEDGRYYIVMELMAPQPKDISQTVSGQTLAVRLNQGPLTLHQALKWAIQFCRGMEYLNQKGMKAHKDIKPANLFITPSGDLKIGDFGLAGRAKGGTKGYLPPEMFEDGELDVRSDIYSFGLVLYQMLNGGRSRAEQTVFLPDDQTFDLLDEAALEKSPLGEILKKCLARRKTDRYADFTALRQALEEVYRPEEVPVLPMAERTAAEFFYQGMGFYKLQEYSAALTCYTRAIEKDPTLASAYSNRGMIWDILLEYAKALEDYTQALQINPEYVSAYYNRALIYQQLKQYQAALADYTRALDRDKSHIKSYYNRGLVWHALGEYKKAVDDYTCVVELAKKNANYKNLAEKAQQTISEAVQDNRLSKYLVKKATIQTESFGANYFYEQGKLQEKEGNFLACLRNYQKALFFDKHHASYYAGSARGRSGLGDLPGALADWDRAVLLDNKNAVYLASRGRIYCRLHQEAAGLEDYMKAKACGLSTANLASFIDKKEEPFSVDWGEAWLSAKPLSYWIVWAEIKSIQGDHQAVVNIYNQAEKRFALQPQQYMLRAHAHLALEQYEEVLSDCQQALKYDAKWIEPYILMGDTQMLQQHYAEAVSHYNHALELDGQRADCYLRRAKAKAKMGDHRAAAEDADKGGIYSGDYDITCEIFAAQEQEALGEYQEAVNRYSALIEQKPWHADCYFFRSRVRLHLNQIKESLKDLQTAIKLKFSLQPVDKVLSENQKNKEVDELEALDLFSKAIGLDPHCARYYIERGRIKGKISLTDALKDLNEGIWLDPSQADYYALRASFLVRKEDLNGALADYTHAIELDPQADYYAARAAIYAKLKNTAAALADYQTAIQKNPKAAYYVGRAYFYESQENYPAALNDLNRVIELEPAPLYYERRACLKQKMKDWPGAQADYNALIAAVPEDSNALKKFLVARIDIRKQLQDFDGVLQDCNELISRDPQAAAFYALRAEAKVQLNDWQGALADCRKAKENGFPTGKYSYFCGSVEEKLGYLHAAEADYQQAAALYPQKEECRLSWERIKQKLVLDGSVADSKANENSFACIARAQQKEQNQDWAGAFDEYAEAIAWYPQNDNAYFGRGLLKERLADPAGALQDYYRALELNSQQARYHTQCAQLEEKQGNLQAARQHYAKMAQAEPQCAAHYANCARMEEQLGDWAAARQHYAKAAEAEPQSAAHYANCARMEEKLGDWAAARENYAKAAQAEPQSAAHYANCARMKEKTGNDMGALLDWTRAIGCHSQNAFYYARRARVEQRLNREKEAGLDYAAAFRLDPSGKWRSVSSD